MSHASHVTRHASRPHLLLVPTNASLPTTVTAVTAHFPPKIDTSFTLNDDTHTCCLPSQRGHCTNRPGTCSQGEGERGGKVWRAKGGGRRQRDAKLTEHLKR